MEVLGCQRCPRRYKPGTRPTLRSTIAARPTPVSPSRYPPTALSSPTHCERSGARSKSGPRPAKLDASRCPQLAELLRLAPRRRRPQADRARHPRALEQQRRPLGRRGGLRLAVSRTIPRWRSPMPRLDARRTRRRGLAGSRALRRSARRLANVAAARRLDRSAVARSRLGGGRPAGRADGRTVAHHRARGADDRDRTLAAGRLGADGQHAIRTGLALFEIAASRLASASGILADLLGRGALCAARRPAFHDAVGDDHRADRRGAWVAVRGRPTSSRRSSRFIGRSASARSPGRGWLRSSPLSRRAPGDNATRNDRLSVFGLAPTTSHAW